MFERSLVTFQEDLVRGFDTLFRGHLVCQTSSLAAAHPQLTPLSLDITHEPQVAEAIAKIQSEVDQLHLVINCVGLLHDDTLQPEKSL